MLTDSTIDKDKLIKICLVHDLAESIVGDITPYDGVSKEQKRRLEENAFQKIVDDLDHKFIAAELLSLWLEYEYGTSTEATVAKELDKFEMIVQADEYEKQQGKVLQSFFDSTESSFHHPEVVHMFLYDRSYLIANPFLQILGWARELRSRRLERLSSRIGKAEL